MRKSLFSTKMIVATGIGAALFLTLFYFVKIPSWAPETNIQIAYGVSAFLGALFGPICGALVAFIGHALNDTLAYGSQWWSWIIASGVTGFIGGLAYYRMDIESGRVSNNDLILFNIIQIIAILIGFGLVAPVLDIVIYAEPVNKVFVQGFSAGFINIIAACVVGTTLVKVYASTRTQKGSLSKR